MAPEGWLRLRELFAAAVLLAPAERAPFLDRECGGDADLRREVESLLRHDPGPEVGSEVDSGDETAFDPAAAGSREGPGAPSRRRSEAEAAESVAVGDQVGNIRIVEVLGAGGMGKVYVGFDETLQRKVALKAIGGRHRLRPEARARFLREARILSQLEHPNICRIHDYLVHGDSELLVLELIDGPTLSKAVADGLGFQRQLEIAGKIAEVLAAAHKEGIIHRDLKPDNVMLTRAGEVKVLDFGLARAVEAETGEGDPPLQGEARAMVEPPPVDATDITLAAPGAESTADGGDRTLTFPGGTPALTAERDLSSPFPVALRTLEGSVMGTPLYMSPEQARGEEVTTASDMYSFGLLLQKLFTGESPYPGSLDGRQILDRARRGETRPVAGVDRDVAALVGQLKSVAPAARPTAVAALERLRWIRDKPRRRLRRLIAAAVAAVVVLAGLKYTFDLRRERASAVAARQDAVAARAVAEQRRSQAEDLIGFMLGDLRTKLAPVNRLEVLDDLGDKALDYFAAVPADELSSKELLFRSKSLSQIGQVRMDQGDLGAAMEAFEDSLALARDLAERDSQNNDWLVWLGEAHFWIGWVDFKRGELDRALASFREYLELSRELVETQPDNPDWQLELSYAQNNIGSVLRAQGEAEAAIEAFRSSVAIKRRLLDRQPDNAQWKSDLAGTYVWLGGALLAAGDLDGALRSYRSNRELMEGLAEEQPTNSRWQWLLGIAHEKVGSILEIKGRLEEALERYLIHLEINQELAQRDAENSTWQGGLATAHFRVGDALVRLGEIDRGADHLRAAESILHKLAARDASNSLWQRFLAYSKTGLAEALVARGLDRDALEKSAQAVEISEELFKDHAADSKVRLASGRSHLVLGEVQSRLGRAEDATAAFHRVLEAIGPASDTLTHPRHRAIRAQALLRLGRLEEAEPIVADLYRQGYRSTELEKLCRERGVWP